MIKKVLAISLIIISISSLSNAQSIEKFPSLVENYRYAGYPFIWQNPEGAEHDDNNHAYILVYASGGPTDYLKASHFNFNIPENATIDGIEVFIKKDADFGGYVTDYMVKIVDSNSHIVGYNKADKTTHWNDMIEHYGGTSDTWGLQLTPDIVNDIDFGVAISAMIHEEPRQYTKADVFYIKMIVYYHTEGGNTNIGIGYSGEYNTKNTIDLAWLLILLFLILMSIMAYKIYKKYRKNEKTMHRS